MPPGGHSGGHSGGHGGGHGHSGHHEERRGGLESCPSKLYSIFVLYLLKSGNPDTVYGFQLVI